MKKNILTLLFVFTLSVSYSQDSIVYFSDALKTNVTPYINASNVAYNKKDFVEGQRLFDSLVQYKLVGTRFDDFTIKGYRSKDVNLNKIKKPVFIITYASWCVINKGDIPALNKLAKEHRDDIQFIVLFWDKKSNIKKFASQFGSPIKVCYADETTNKQSRIVATLKHTLGFPTSFFIDENKKVINIKRVVNRLKPRTSAANALSISYENFSKNINELTLNKTSAHSKLVVN